MITGEELCCGEEEGGGEEGDCKDVSDLGFLDHVCVSNSSLALAFSCSIATDCDSLSDGDLRRCCGLYPCCLFTSAEFSFVEFILVSVMFLDPEAFSLSIVLLILVFGLSAHLLVMFEGDVA